LPLSGSRLEVEIDGESRPMCCAGCAAVAEAIVASGNSDYYRFREDKSPTGRDLVPDFLEKIRVYDHPAVQQQFVHRSGGEGAEDIREVSLIIEGIVCAACLWLNEQYLHKLPGVVEVSINYSTHRARVRWDNDRIRLSRILEAISQIGYLAHPYDPETQQKLFEEQRKSLIRRIGIAGLFGMQVMMFALVLYTGEWWGISDRFREFFRWLSWLLATPILFYSAQPFFRGAWQDLKLRRAGMDVPVSLGMGLAYLASAWHVWTGEGHVYFDSIAMFTFFLLSVRLFELSARKKAAEKIEELTDLTPTLSNRITADGEIEVVPTVELQVDDRVLVRPGEIVPTDGRLLSAHALVDEALLTGEQHPVRKHCGDTLIGGSYNLDQPIELQVSHLGQDTVLSGIRRLIEQAQSYKPDIARLADRVASVFVLVLLLLVAVASVWWWRHDPSQVLQVVVAMLVVTCPCALSLATPASLSAAIGSLTRRGMLVAQSRALEVMPRVDTVVFDKTGTLTTGELVLERQFDADPAQQAHNRLVAHSLELHSEHPVARALVDDSLQGLAVAQRVNHPGRGVEGVIDGRRYYLGNAGFIRERARLPETLELAEDRQIVFLARDGQWLAGFVFNDPLKADARETVDALRAMGLEVRILSGDRESYVAAIARQLGIDHWDAEQLPEQKLLRVKQWQSEGRRVAMVGDGINDAPVLAAADLSVSLSFGADLARAAADLVINGGQLQPLVDAFRITRKTLRVIRQNFAWAVGYNIVAVPFAMAALVPPWLAAIGMSLSSLVVVLNALRLRN
jgi:Cu2+-exporting ATPase